MRTTSIQKIVLVVSLMFASTASFGIIEDYDKSGCTLGRWTYDLTAARKVAKENDSMILVSFMKNDGSCGVCNATASSLLETEVFKEWAKVRKIPLLIADYASNSSGSSAFDRSEYLSFPVLIFIDGRDGTTRLAWFNVNSGTIPTGNGVAATTPKPSKGYMIKSIKDDFYALAEWTLALQNNAPYSAKATGASNHRNATAQEIVPDMKGLDASLLEVHEIWKVGGVNDLSSKHWVNRKVNWAFWEDQYDWWKFTKNTDETTTYEIKTPTLEDPSDIGYVCVFTNQADAVASTTYETAMSNAYWKCKLGDLSENGKFTVAGKRDVYLLFTRRDVVDYTEDLTLRYTFTLQEAADEAFYFDENEELTLSRTNMAANVTIYRTSAGRESEVDVDFAYVAGGVYLDDYYTLMFDANETNNTQTISLRDWYTAEKFMPNGVICLELDDLGGEMPENGTLTKEIKVVGDPIGNDDGATKAEAHPLSLDGTTAWAQTGTRNLNSTVTNDWLVVSNATAGATYYLYAKQLVGPTDVNPKVTVFTNGVEMATYTAADFENVSSQMFAVAGPLDDGTLELCVSRDADSTVRFEYELKLREVPQVSFEAAESTAEVPSVLPLKVRSSLKSTEAFPISVTWETATTNELAKENVDFAKIVATTNIAVGAAECTIEVPVLENLNAYSPARSFLVKLDESVDGEYTFGAVKDVVVKLAADVVGNKDGATTNTAHQVTAVKTTAWASSGERNLNNTVTNDWVAFASVTTGTYRLGADLIAPQDATKVGDDAQVTVYTNGVAWITKPLATIAAEAPAFEITDDVLTNGLTNAVLLVSVSRASNETVRLEYDLKLRALPVISFEAAESAADVPSALKLSVNSTLPSSEEFPIVFGWQTLSTNDLAKADVDFASISTISNIAVGASSCAIEVPVLENQAAYSPARSFLVQLGASKTGDYVLGETTNVVVKLEGDEVGNGDAGAKMDTPYDVTIEDTKSWAKAGVRNLNNTVTNDWIAFAPVAAGTYRLGAELVAPQDATAASVTDAQVTVVTNGAAWISYTLADVATNAPAFEITEEILKDLTDNKLLVSVARSSNETVRLEYNLMLRAWSVPKLTATVSAAEVEDTNTTVKVTLTRGGEANDYETKIAVRSQNGVAALAGREYEAVDKVVTIPAGTNEVDFAVTLIPETSGVWRGDRAFTLAFDVERADLYSTNGLAATVTLKEVDPEFEKDDSTSESADAPSVTAPLGDEPQTFARTLHGADANDYFTFSDAETGVYYSFEAETTESNTVNATGLKLIATYPDGTSETKNFPVEKFEKMMTQDGDIKVQIVRDDNSTAAKPVSVGYVLTTGVRYVPRYQLATSAISTDDTNTAVTVTVERLDNTNEESRVQIATSNVTAIAGTAAPNAAYVALSQTLTFAKGETNKTVTITLLPENNKIYTGDRTFAVSLSVLAASEDHLGEPKACTVTLKDVDAEIDSFDKDDDDRGTTKNLFAVARTVTPAGEHRLNGSDLVDWYKFQGVSAGRYYKFGLEGEPELNNCTADEINVSIYADGITNEATPTTNVTFAALADGAMVRLAEKTTTSTDILVKVWREKKSEPVSVAYNLTFREQPPQTVTFATDRVEVSELADAAYIDVVCSTDGGEALEADVTATLSFADGTADETERDATAPADYDATEIALKWDAGTTGGTKRVRLPLANYGTDWKGDRGYTVFLTPDDDTDIAADGTDEATVWILEKDTPTYGTIAQTAVNGETLTKTTTLAVREGDEMSVDVTLADGISSVVTGEWTIAVGKVKTVVAQELFAAEELAQTKTFAVTVPETDGFQLSQSATVTFAIKAATKTVSLAKTDVTSFKLMIADKDYAGAVADVAKADATQPAFRASASAWFLDTDGAYRAAIPAAGASVVLTTTVTGSGTLSFDAAIPEGCALVVKSSGADSLTAQAGENTFAVASGTRTVTFTLTHTKGATVAADAEASVSNVVFTRSEEANTYGTFVGAAQKDGAEGLGTLTVAANGRMSGKFQFAGETWTFSATGGWDENSAKSVTAKCKGQSVALQLWADATAGLVTVTSDDASWAATLYRNAWADKPKSEAMVELAEAAPGYYTAALPDAAGEVGSGYLTLTIGNAGAVKATGKLADGRSVTLSGVLTEGGIRLFTAPSAYRGGCFATTMEFDAAEQTLTGTGAWSDKTESAPFDREVRVSGGWYDKTINLQEYYESGLTVGTIESVGDYTLRGKEYDATAWAASADIPVSLTFGANGRVTATEEGGDDRGARLFSMNVNRATGLFSGYLRAEYDVDGRTIRKSSTYRGVLTPVRFDTSDPEGRGFFLMNGDSYDFTIEGN